MVLSGGRVTVWRFSEFNDVVLVGRSLQQFDSTFDLRKAHHRINFNPSEGGDLRETSLDVSEFEDK